MTALWGYLGLLRGKTAARLAATAILSLLAAGATVGLLALSGGLIASCAIAGSATAFSIYAPSGGVRTFALTRILARYGERLSAHAISLEVADSAAPPTVRRPCGAPCRRAAAVRIGRAT